MSNFEEQKQEAVEEVTNEATETLVREPICEVVSVVTTQTEMVQVANAQVTEAQTQPQTEVETVAAPVTSTTEDVVVEEKPPSETVVPTENKEEQQETEVDVAGSETVVAATKEKTKKIKKEKKKSISNKSE
jgi:hypothetical protein